MAKPTDYVFNKAETIKWITDSEPILHCNDCKYYDLNTSTCGKLLDSLTKRPLKLKFNSYCFWGVENDLPF
mgnify:CR=1 FL=1